MLKVHFKTLGCRLNEAELETWAQAFRQAGHQVATELEQAQLVVINTCAVTQDAVRKSRQLIRRIHRGNPLAKLVVSGCYATLNSEEAARLMGVDLVVGNQDKNQLVEKTLSELNLNAMPAMSAEPGAVALFGRGRQRAFIKVQDGCRYRCSFCIVTVARGEEQSRSINSIVDEINALHGQGVREAVLTGVHLGGFGSDANSNLSDLIKAILERTAIERLRLGSLEPWELPDDFFALFKNPRLTPHLHLPLQSGSDSVLRRMTRRCKTAEFARLAELARACTPYFNITTDIIVGFPGETESEWLDSLAFIKQIGFGHIHIFNYSPREGTKAATLTPQISPEIKKQRSRELHALAEQMQQNFISRNIGSVSQVLWEGQTEQLTNGRIRRFGYTANYIRAACDTEADVQLENRITPARLLSVNNGVANAALE